MKDNYFNYPLLAPRQTSCIFTVARTSAPSFIALFFSLSSNPSSSLDPLFRLAAARSVLTLRIIYRFGLKSTNALSSFLSLFVLFYLLLSCSLSFTLCICSDLFHIIFFMCVPVSVNYQIHTGRLYVNSVICKSDERKCFRGIRFKDT